MAYMQRVARSAQDAIKTLPKAGTLTTSQKKATLRNILASEGGVHKVGQGMIGPILMRLQYEGIARNILQEDPLEKGAGFFYDVATDVGVAYRLDGYGAQVKVQEFEGKRVRYECFPISAYPQILKEDLYALRLDMVEYAKNEATQGIMRTEDRYLIDLLDATVTNSATKVNPINPDATGLRETTYAQDITYDAMLEAAKFADYYQLEAVNLIMHPAMKRDIYKWDLTTLGVVLKDEIMATGAKVSRIGEFNILTSVMMDPTKAFLVPEMQYLGMMPVLWSLDSVENDKPEERKTGWVMDESVNMLVLNPFGVSRIAKVGESE